MEIKDIISLVEQALDKKFNEDTIGKIIDDKLKAHLAPLNKSQVIVGDVTVDKGPGVTFSQWLGDLVRVSKGAPALFTKNTESAFIKGVTGINPKYLAALAPEARKSLYEATDSAGGYLVPTEEARILLDLTTNWAVIEGLCQAVPMRTNQITFPTLTSGLTAYWIPEAQTAIPSTQATGAKVESSPTFAAMTITTHVLAILVYVSNQLLDDSDPSIDQVLYNIFGKTLGKYFDIACLGGTGAATDPVYGLDSLVTTNLLTTGALADFDDIVDLIYSCLDNTDGGTTTIDILGHTKAERVLLKVKDNDGQYVYKRPLDPKGVGSLWGEPWRRDNNITTTSGTNSDKTKVYAGDFANYGYVGSRNQIVIKANPWGDGFPTNQTIFLAEFRKGFQISKESVFSILSGFPTQ